MAKQKGFFHSIMKIIKLAVGTIIAIVLTIILTYSFMHKSFQENPEDEKDKVKKNIPKMGETFELADMPVTIFTGEKRDRFLRVKIVLEVNSSDVFSELEERKPQLIDKATKILSGIEYEKLKTMYEKNESGKTGFDILKTQLRDAFNYELMTGYIVNVYLPKFTVQ